MWEKCTRGIHVWGKCVGKPCAKDVWKGHLCVDVIHVWRDINMWELFMCEKTGRNQLHMGEVHV